MGSIYKNKWGNLREKFSDAGYKLRNSGYQANQTVKTIGFAAWDINERMKAGDQRAFGKNQRKRYR